MAKKLSNGTGIKIQGDYEGFLNLDINTLNRLNQKELKEVTSRLISVANKRIKRARATASKNNSTLSPAMRSLPNEDFKFSIKGKSYNDVKHVYSQVRNFLNAKTSTHKGWNQYKEEVQQNLESRFGKMSEEQSNKFWNGYHKFEERNAGILKTNKDTSDQMMEYLADLVKNNDDLDSDDLQEALDDYLDQIYEEEEDEEDESGFSDLW